MLSLDAPGIRSSTRLEAYSDALFSIVATVMIVPISHVELPEDEALKTSFIRLLLPKILVYMYTFLVVSYNWGVHVWLCETISSVDEYIVLLNLISLVFLEKSAVAGIVPATAGFGMMMIVSFMPFTFTMLGMFALDSAALVIFGGVIVLLGILQVLFIFHVFRHPAMLTPELRTIDMTVHRNKMYHKVLTPTLLGLIGVIFSFFWEFMALVFYILILIGDFIRRRVLKWYRRCRQQCSNQPPDDTDDMLDEFQDNTFRGRLLKETIKNERTECFSDGVFAIVATLIILDICENNIPSDEDIDKYGSLWAALGNQSQIFLAYAGTFVTVALQWYVHHSLLHYVVNLNILMVIFNHLCLFCIGLTPLTFKLTSSFESHKVGDNEAIAILIHSTTIFMASMFQASLWVTGLFNQDKHVMPSARHGGKDHFYMTAKLSIYPIVSLLTYYLAMLGSSFTVALFVVVQLCTIGVFVLLGLSVTYLVGYFRRREGSVQGTSGIATHNIEDDLFAFNSTSSHGSAHPVHVT